MLSSTINYVKNRDITQLREDARRIGFSAIQQYNPIYSRFFSLNERNWNHIQLNSAERVSRIFGAGGHHPADCFTDPESLEETESADTNMVCSVELEREDPLSGERTTRRADCFLKCIPIFSPLKYVCGDVDLDDIPLPTYERDLESGWAHPQDEGISYTDGFFYFLSSRLRDLHGFPNAVGYYGSHVGVKRTLYVDVGEDMEYLHSSSGFLENLGDRCDFADSSIQFSHTRGNRAPLSLGSVGETSELDVGAVDAGNDVYMAHIGTAFSLPQTGTGDCDVTMADLSGALDLEFESATVGARREDASGDELDDDSDSESDLNSDVDIENGSDDECEEGEEGEEGSEDEEGDEDEEGEEDESDVDESDVDEEEESVMLGVHNFPAHMVWLELVDGQTLEEYVDTELSERGEEEVQEEFAHILAQVIFSLLTFQKAFNMSHNDLHTHNIMYCDTDAEYIDYTYEGSTYRVKTFGKLWKIIDFGRATYSFDGRVLWSSDFNFKNDAKTQFNCYPYLNPDKPVVMPTQSFDLCRLGCSLFTFLCTTPEDWAASQQRQREGAPPGDLLSFVDWTCRDDHGNNVMFKSLDRERYEGFKLYKMITRTVSAPTPANALRTPYIRRHVPAVAAEEAELEAETGAGAGAGATKVLRFSIDSVPSYAGASPQ
jgi:hypothetical protein